MNSRAWTEVAIGGEARGLRRSAARAVLPRVWEVLVFMLLSGAVAVGFEVLHDALVGQPQKLPGCFECSQPVREDHSGFLDGIV